MTSCCTIASHHRRQEEIDGKMEAPPPLSQVANRTRSSTTRLQYHYNRPEPTHRPPLQLERWNLCAGRMDTDTINIMCNAPSTSPPGMSAPWPIGGEGELEEREEEHAEVWLAGERMGGSYQSWSTAENGT